MFPRIRTSMTPARAVLTLAAAIVVTGSAVAVAASSTTLAAGDSLTVSCGGPSLAWSATSATSGTLQCAANPATTTPVSTSSTAPPGPVSWWTPGPLASWQWQLSGTIDTSKPVQVYDIDWQSAASVVSTLHGQGKRVICYVDVAFENYRPDAGDFPAAVLGSSIGGWPDERYVDVRALDAPTGPTGKTLRQIMAGRFETCRSKGFDAVETDLDAEWQAGTGFPVTMADYENYDRALAADIHSRNMAWFLKNGITGTSFISDMVSVADGTVNEECWAYAECGELRPFADAQKPILNAVYAGTQASICPQANTFPMATMRKYTSLDARVVWHCWP